VDKTPRTTFLAEPGGTTLVAKPRTGGTMFELDRKREDSQMSTLTIATLKWNRIRIP
jgi:hypothetical protein